MRILGINGSPRKDGVTSKLLTEVLNATGLETELVQLAGKRISPCTACLECVKDNVCKIKDDMYKLRSKIVEADAYVIGGANYYEMMNGLTHCFLERFYQFYHLDGKAVAGKPAVVVGVGGASGEPAAGNIKALLEYNRIKVLHTITGQGPVSCFICGFGEKCEVGGIHRFFGPGTKITPEITPSLDKQPDVIAKAHQYGKSLAEYLQK